MNPDKRENYRKRLLELRTQILNRANKRRLESLTLSPDDLADETDHAAAVIQQSVAISVQDRDRKILHEIEHALSKFEDGTYGLCEDTEEPIDEGRLDAEPYTRYSVEAAEIRERKAKRYASNG